MFTDTSSRKHDLERALSAAQMVEIPDDLNVSGQLGNFSCRPRRHDGFAYNLRKYETGNESLTIPVYSDLPVVTMIFQFKGSSFYQDKHNPFTLPNSNHSFNFFNRFDCRSLLREKTSIHDMTFVLNKNFYQELLGGSTLLHSHLTEIIMEGREINTISSGLPMDASIRVILDNILTCPFIDSFREAYIAAQLRALFILQFCQFHYNITDKPIQLDNRITPRDREIVHDIKAYLHKSYMDATSLEKLTRAFGINEFKLKYGFKLLFGSSPIHYALDLRMQHAMNLLRNTDQSINEISRTVGYQHPNNFSIAFRKKFGMTPSTCRN